jgi:hypothetical protein
LEAPQFTTDIFSRKLGTAGEKVFENLSTLLSESAPGFVPMLCPFYFSTDRNLPFVEYAGEKNFSAGTGFDSGDFQNLARR